jgi:serine/threonine protein phosphatase PrpC
MLLQKNALSVEYATKLHGRGLDKPNEDRLLADKERGIFIVLDGVTRVHKEYDATPNQSAAGDVGDIFLKAVYEYICEHLYEPNPRSILEEAVRIANAKIKDYRRKKSLDEWGFYPSTLGIISILRGKTLHYLCVGDCIGVLIRYNSKIIFGRELTVKAVDLCGTTKSDRYALYCNHPENHLSYTVFNGDEVVMDGVQYSLIDLHDGDVLFLASDGISDYLKYEKAVDLILKSPEIIIEDSGRYDAPPFASYADDKTLIKLQF